MSPTVRTQFPVDPRVEPLVATLTDAQVANVLCQMNAAWSPDMDVAEVLGSPASNRTLVVATFTLNIGMGGEPEYTTLESFAAIARAAEPAYAVD